MLASKKLTDYTNLFSPHDLKKNNNIILSYFDNECYSIKNNSIEYNSIKNNSLETIDKRVLSEETKF